MKKMLLCFLILVSGHIYGQFHPAEVFYLNGESRKGYVNPPDATDKNVKFKSNEHAAAQKIKSSELSHIVFEPRDGESREIIRMLPKVGGKLWADVVVKGPMSLYKYVVIGRRQGMSGRVEETASTHYYCKRENEKRAGCLLPNLFFAKTTAGYFSDYPELADKIRNRQQGYQPQDLTKIVIEYNKWINDK